MNSQEIREGEEMRPGLSHAALISAAMEFILHTFGMAEVGGWGWGMGGGRKGREEEVTHEIIFFFF